MESLTLELYLLVFFSNLIFSSLLVPLLRKIAFRFSILDKPNQSHKTHQDSVPYLGGLAIVIPVSCIAFVGPLIIIEGSEYVIRTILILVPPVTLAVVGLLDDINNLSARIRFLVQSLLAIIMTLVLSEFALTVSITDSSFANFLISIIWLVGITNAFNFLDNLDGGAAGVTVISSLSLFILSHNREQFLISFLSLAFAGASFGFLFWNRNPAKIFLGDSGALFIGFFMAFALLQFDPKVESRFVSILIPIFLMALPILDTTVAVLSRLFRGASIFVGARDHLSHRLVSRGMTRRKCAYTLWAIAASFAVLSIIMSNLEGFMSLGISILGLIAMLLLSLWFLRIKINS